MKGIILAAGRGSRMGAHTEDQPKCLLEVDGKPLLSWQLDTMRAGGIEDVAIVTGYRGDLLENFGTQIFENVRWAETNMVMSLARARSWLLETDCIVSYADIFYEPHAVRRLAEPGADIAVAYDPSWRSLWEQRFADPLDDAETFRLDSRGRLLEIGHRPQRVDDVEGQYMGLLRFAPAGWGAVEGLLDGLSPADADRLDMTSLLGRLIEAGLEIRAVPYEGRWGEVDHPSDLALYGCTGATPAN